MSESVVNFAKKKWIPYMLLPYTPPKCVKMEKNPKCVKQRPNFFFRDAKTRSPDMCHYFLKNDTQ